MGICSVWLCFPLFSFPLEVSLWSRASPRQRCGICDLLECYFPAPSHSFPGSMPTSVNATHPADLPTWVHSSQLLWPYWAPLLTWDVRCLVQCYTVWSSRAASSYQTHWDCGLRHQNILQVLPSHLRGEWMAGSGSLTANMGLFEGVTWPTYNI